MRVLRLAPSRFPHRRVALTAAAACVAGVAAPAAASAASRAVLAPAAASAVSRVTLAPAEPAVTDVAAQGGTVAWLSGDAPKGRGETRPRYLSVRDDGTKVARRLELRLPKGTDAIDVGTDAAGRPVALLGTATHTWTVPLTAGVAPVARRIPGSARWGAVAMYRGRVAYTRVSKGRPTVFVARRPGATSRRTFTFPRPYGPEEIALAANDVVVAHGYRPVDNGAADVLWRVKGTARRLLTQSAGGASENGMGRPTVTDDGTRVNVSRWNVGGGHPNDLTTFSARTGRVLSTAKAATAPGAEAVFQLGLDGGQSVIFAASYSGCSTPSIPVDDAPACLGLDLIGR